MAVKKGKNLKKNNVRGKNKNTSKLSEKEQEQFKKLRTEIKLLIMLTVSVVLFIGVLGGGKGPLIFIGGFLFGLFGVLGYIFPVALFVLYTFVIANENHKGVKLKSFGIVFLFLSMNSLIHLLTTDMEKPYNPAHIYLEAIKSRAGGGVVGSIFATVLYNFFGKLASTFILFSIVIIALILLTQRSFLGGVKKGGNKIYKTTVSGFRKRREEFEEKHRDMVSEEEMTRVSEVFQIGNRFDLHKDERSTEPGIREVCVRSEIETRPADAENGMKEIYVDEYEGIREKQRESEAENIDRERIESVSRRDESCMSKIKEEVYDISNISGTDSDTKEGGSNFQKERESFVFQEEERSRFKEPSSDPGLENMEEKVGKEPCYLPPPLNLLSKGEEDSDSLESTEQIREKLETTLKSFNVEVSVTGISVGPTVTRYELSPAPGVKVSKIQALSNDIKMALAASDIRIEAPIPGKSAVGVEVPNEKNSTVKLRSLLEDEEFQKTKCSIPFAVGKDLSNKTVVEDIAKMPHLLIAGATGSGKSVCINTLIMSILYKAHPDDVKMIMIDPKVVELSIYNGIPHLLAPIVTDPKKAAGALNWAVAEMGKRYKMFAAAGVRDLKGYNSWVSDQKNKESEEEEKADKLPQIVIIVDELADLMMASAKEVEDSICRLAQLARAAGMHLIIATQRPSVNVITGLIKANMPSRIAFSVSSGVDSRTILDMNGAEKLLGKGDMLFGPQWLQKPIRLQGAFVSDKEVASVAEYLKEQAKALEASKEDNSIDEEINQAMNSSLLSESDNGHFGDDLDPLFEDAVRLVIDKEKASIGMLQRTLKIGFNRAGRIMDQMEAEGIVGADEGTKPRTVLMDSNTYEDYKNR